MAAFKPIATGDGNCAAVSPRRLAVHQRPPQPPLFAHGQAAALKRDQVRAERSDLVGGGSSLGVGVVRKTRYCSVIGKSGLGR